ncbi:receptor protein EIX2 [Trifolium repens]|nr:receptor protein EIX2 [Trifolium repens]KAK2431220.1 receptor protein EIX2 [Trifolium repens]
MFVKVQRLQGRLPQNRFLRKLNICSCCPNQYGIGPGNLLYPRSSTISSTQFSKEIGTFPVKLLLRYINTLSASNDPIVDGTSPDKLLSLKSKYSSAFK